MSQDPQIQQTAMLAGVIGQVGCLTVIIIGMALGAGIYLDQFLNTRPIFTILLLVGSVPVSLYIIVRVTLTAVARSQAVMAVKKSEEMHDE